MTGVKAFIENHWQGIVLSVLAIEAFILGGLAWAVLCAKTAALFEGA